MIISSRSRNAAKTWPLAKLRNLVFENLDNALHNTSAALLNQEPSEIAIDLTTYSADFDTWPEARIHVLYPYIRAWQIARARDAAAGRIKLPE